MASRRNCAALGAILLGLAASLCSTPPAAAQEPPDAYPTRNIMWIIPYPPGGPPDVVARALGPVLGEILGKPLVVENRPGASTSIGATAVARAAPDGYTILASDIAQTVAPVIMKAPSFDIVKDFKHVGLTAKSVFTIIIDPQLPIKTIEDLVSYTKKNPGAIKVGHSGVGTPPHLGCLSFMQTTGADMLLVPYRGVALAVQDVIAGHIQLVCTAPSTTVALTQDGKVRMLAVSGDQRLTALPEVPTLRERSINIKGFDKDNWFGISVPLATPDAIVEKLNMAVAKAVQNKDAIDRLAKVDIKLLSSTPKDFSDLVTQQVTAWREVLTTAGVKAE